MAAAMLALGAGCGPKLSEEEKTAPPPAGPETYQAPPEGATGSAPPPGPAGPATGAESGDSEG